MTVPTEQVVVQAEEAKKRTLTLRKQKKGGQVEGVVCIGTTWYVEVFGTTEEAQAFARRWNMELILPKDKDEMPEGAPQGYRGG